MGRFAGGVVRFERSVKVADYENAKATAEISWSADEDWAPAQSAAHAEAAMATAMAQVYKALGLNLPERAVAPQPFTTATATEAHATQPAASRVAPAAHGNGTLAEAMREVAEMGAVTATLGGKPITADTAMPAAVDVTVTVSDKDKLAAAVTGEPAVPGVGEVSMGIPASFRNSRKAPRGSKKGGEITIISQTGVTVEEKALVPDPLDMTTGAAPTVTEQPASAPAPAVADMGAADPDGNFSALPEARQYTTAELNAACTATIERLTGLGGREPGIQVRQFVGKFGGSTATMPQEKRGQFLAELALLQPVK